MIKISNEKKINKTYQKIIKAALPVFASKGFNETTLDEIVKIAGVGKGTIYNHFKNKEDLFRKIIEISVDELFEKLTHTFDIDELIKLIEAGKINQDNYSSVCSQLSHTKTTDWDSPIDDHHPMVVTAKNYFSYALVNPNFFVIILKTIGDVKNNRGPFIKNILKQKIIEKKLNIVIEADIKNQKLINIKAETLIMFVLGTFNNFVYHWLMNDRAQDMNTLAITAAKLITNGVRYRKDI